MSNWRTSLPARIIAVIVCVLSASAAFWATYVTLYYWSDLWSDRDYYDSSSYYRDLYDMNGALEELLLLQEQAQRDEGLPYSEQTQLSELAALFDPAKTNYRYQVYLDDAQGTLVTGNTGDAALTELADGVQTSTFTLVQGDEWVGQDTAYWDESLEGEIHRDMTATGYVESKAADYPHTHNAYGWYSDGDTWQDYDQNYDTRVQYTNYVLQYGAAKEMAVSDAFSQGKQAYEQWQSRLPAARILAVSSALLFAAALSYLCCAAGYRRGEDGVTVRGLDKVPLDLLAGVYFCAVLGLIVMIDAMLSQPVQLTTVLVVGVGSMTVLLAALSLALLLTLVVRIKARCVFRNTLIWRFCAWVGLTLSGMLRLLAMNVRAVLLFLGYLLVNGMLAMGLFQSYEGGFYLLVLIALNGVVLMALCRWVSQWRRIRLGTARIVGGDPTAQIDTAKLFPDLKEHAAQLNDLGDAINQAVEQRMKSEHFKAELITNVSHDLKTPLTSIINYVDLLKKEEISNPKVLEYLEVLERKSQRLKKLTEDLVEASKASTGNVTVAAARMDLAEFAQQALAEYEDRMDAQRLTVITKMPDHPVHISADGRHMWRILDNLLSNCVKYAMEATRVYLDVVEWDGKASISLKNISRDPLNLTAEELTERFVRGDASRTTEGSGLGLSIARSLTEVQGGTFRVVSDGDLFKVSVFCPALSD